MDTPEVISPVLLEAIQKKQETLFFQEALKLYIPPQVGRYVRDDDPKDAAECISHWLSDNQSACLLLLGDSGAGKTLFGQWLTRHFFQTRKSTERIPLFIPLLTQSHLESGLLDHYLKKKLGIVDERQRNFIKDQPLLLIFDGFDEVQNKIKDNLYRTNALWKLKDAKIIMSCRSQALAHIHDANALFYPCDERGQSLQSQLQEYTICPFTKTQIEAYIKKHIELLSNNFKKLLETAASAVILKNNWGSLKTEEATLTFFSYLDHNSLLSMQYVSKGWQHAGLKKQWKNAERWMQWETYYAYIKKLPGLKQLLTSPFILSLVVQVLPSLIQEHRKENIEELKLARINFYDHFIKKWFERQKEKLIKAGYITENCPIEEAFTEYSKALAFEMLQNRVYRVKYIPQENISFKEKRTVHQFSSLSNTEKKDPWAIFFSKKKEKIGNEDVKLPLVRAGCPLIKLGEHEYAFLHASLLEYFADRKLFEGAMYGASMALGYELNKKLLINAPGKLHFIVEKVQQNETLKQRLFDVLEESKYDERVEIAAANAITILNYAGVSLRKDLRRIRIPGADLSNAILDGTDLREADLRNVNLQSAWLNHAKLGGALMEGVEFGELPCLKDESYISCIAYSSEHLASGSDKGISLWETKTGKGVTTFKGHKHTVYSLAFSPNGKLLASCGWDGSVRLWDVISQKIIVVLGHHKSLVNSVAFSPTGEILASGSNDHNVYLWDVAGRKKLGVLNNHADHIENLAFDPNGKILVSQSEDNTIQLWDVSSQNSLSVIDTNTCYDLAFSFDGKILASSEVGGVILRDSSSQKILWKIESLAAYIASHPNKRILALGSQKTIQLWDINNQNCLGVFKGHHSDITNIVFSPDGKILASTSNDTVRLWNIEAQNFLPTLKGHNFLLSIKGHTAAINSITFSPNGKILAFSSRTGCLDGDKKIWLWDMIEQKYLSILNFSSGDANVAFSPDGKILFGGNGKEGGIKIWDIRSQKCVEVCLIGFSHNMALSLDGKILAGNNYNSCTIGLWNVAQQKCLGLLQAHTRQINCISFSPDGKILASGSNDRTVRLWDINRKTCLSILSGHKGYVTSLAFSPDGQILVAGTSDDPSNNPIWIWSLEDKKCLGLLKGHTGFVESLAFTFDGKMLASGSSREGAAKDGGIVRLWDTKTHQCLKIFQLWHPVYSLIWRTLDQQSFLCVASGKAIYYFEIQTIESKLEFILLWSIGRDTGLTCSQMDMSGAVVALDKDKNPIGNDAQNELLLQQHGASGKFSTKNTKTVLEARRNLIPYNPNQPPYSLFSNHFVTPQNALVSMVRKKDDQEGYIHIFLVIETIESDYYCITRADFFLDKREQYSETFFKSLVTGQARIEVCVKSLSDMQKLSEICVYKCWKISSQQAQTLLENIEADRQRPLAYLNVGDSSLYSGIEIGKERYNCVDWCEKHLTNIGIDVTEQQSWRDFFVAHSQNHLPDDSDKNNENSSSKPNCLMM